MARCPSCGSKDQRAEVVTPFQPGDQAMTEVLTETFYPFLPEAKALPALNINPARLPGLGRKLLVFSDNRQDAAQFAGCRAPTGAPAVAHTDCPSGHELGAEWLRKKVTPSRRRATGSFGR